MSAIIEEGCSETCSNFSEDLREKEESGLVKAKRKAAPLLLLLLLLSLLYSFLL
jgi:hypothetical protein